MKKILLLTILLSLMSFYHQEEKTYAIKITVNNLRNSKGVVQFTLYNKEGTIPDEKYKKYYRQNIATINNNTVSLTFNNLPKGKYAINILHDENENGKIDKGFLLPKEGIGFSNYNSIGLSNRPKFENAKFDVSQDLQKNIKIIYF